RLTGGVAAARRNRRHAGAGSAQAVQVGLLPAGLRDVTAVGRGDDRRDERLLDGPGADPAGQIEDRTGLVVGAGGAGAAERLLADHRAGGLVVDVEVARREAQPLRRVGDGPAVPGDDRAGQRVGAGA